MTEEVPKVFVSYSWDGEEHQEWVKKLVDDLIGRMAFEVTLDQYDLKAGELATYFMTKGIREADYVIMVCSRLYVDKCNAQQGGVGFEEAVLSAGILNDPLTSKYIPIIKDNPEREMPASLGARIYIDFNDTTKYQSSLEDLARRMHDEPARVKPKKADRPEYKALKRLPENKIRSDEVLEENLQLIKNVEDNDDKYVTDDGFKIHIQFHLASDEAVINYSCVGLREQEIRLKISWCDKRLRNSLINLQKELVDMIPDAEIVRLPNVEIKPEITYGFCTLVTLDIDRADVIPLCRLYYYEAVKETSSKIEKEIRLVQQDFSESMREDAETASVVLKKLVGASYKRKFSDYISE